MTRFTSLVCLRILSEHFSRSLYNSSRIIVPYRINMPSNNATATSLSVVLGTFFCVSLYVHQHFVIIKWNCRKNRSRLEWDLSKKGYALSSLKQKTQKSLRPFFISQNVTHTFLWHVTSHVLWTNIKVITMKKIFSLVRLIFYLVEVNIVFIYFSLHILL